MHEDSGGLSILNKDGIKVAGINADEDGGGTVETFNNKGEPTSSLP